MSKHRLELNDYLRTSDDAPVEYTSQADRLECELLDLYSALDHATDVVILLEKHRFWNRTELAHRNADITEMERRIDGLQLALDIIRAL